MQLDRCRSCGGELERIGNSYVCKFCGSKWVIDADQDVHVIDRANAWSALRDCDFEHATELFENIIFKEPKNHEAYWGRALANAGIMYVTDFHENKKVPTCNSISESSFIDSRDVRKAIELAPADIAESYRAQAEQIEAIRSEWVKKASREPAYDVFISYKDSDREHHIERTEDSYDAQELYMALTEAGYKVFFSRVSLRNKVSEHYEPYIYNAIKTAKVMIVYGEKPEYFNAVWIKNEWMRFRKRIEIGEKHPNSLVVAYKGLDPADLPIGLRSRQCIDASSITFLEDLKQHIEKIIREPKKAAAVKVDEPAAVASPVKPRGKKGIVIAAIAAVLAVCIGLGFVISNLAGGDGETTPVIPLDTEKTTFLPSVSETEAKTEKETPKDTETQVEVETPRETGEVASADTEEATSAATQEPTGEPTLDVTDAPTVEVTDAPTEKETDAPSEKVTENVSEETEEDYGLEYTLNEDESSYSVTGIGECIATDIVIPKQYKGLPVTSIGSKAFYSCIDIVSVKVPDSVKSIGDSAFLGCAKLVNLTLSDNLEFMGKEVFGLSSSIKLTEYGNACYIGSKNNPYIVLVKAKDKSITKCEIPDGTRFICLVAFDECTDLIDVTIPNSIISIESGAFDECNGLENVYISDLSKWCEIDFEDSRSNPLTYATNLYLNGDIVTEVSIPDDVSIIRDFAFYGCNITSLTIHEGVTSIGESAFQGCDKLKSVVIGDGVTNIADYAFSSCAELESITIGEKVLTIGDNAFSYCNKLPDIIIPNSVTNIGKSAFWGCDSLESVTIGSGVKTIEKGAFGECRGLLDIIYAGSEENWKEINIASNNEYLIGVTIHYNGDWTETETETDTESETETETNTDTENDYALDYTLNEGGDSYSVAGIGECRATEIVIPKMYKGLPVTSISEKAFEKCTDLTSVTIGDNVQTIGRYAFSYCEKVTEFVIPKSVRNIESGAFGDCYALKEITIPFGVEVIGYFAFEYCTSLERVYIPSSVKEIRSAVLQGCSAFKGVEFDGTVDEWNSINKYSNWNDDIGDHTINCIADNYVIVVKNETDESETETETETHTHVYDNDCDSDCNTCGAVRTPSAHVYDNDCDIGCNVCGETRDVGEHSYNSENTCTVCGDYADKGLVFTKEGDSYCVTDYTGVEENVVIPSTYKGLPVTSIGYNAFNGCTGLTSISIPNSVTSIGDSAFDGCTSLTYKEYSNAYYLGNAENPYVVLIKAINKNITSCEVHQNAKIVYCAAFNGCASLTSVEIGGNVTSIGGSALSYCTSLTSVVIPDNVTDIAHYAFNGCTSLTSVEIGDNVTSIGAGAFDDCTKLACVKIPNSVTSIEFRTFANCSSLTSVVIPDSVTNIDDRAFSGCTSLTDVCYTGSEASWKEVTIGSSNDYLIGATVHYDYSSETEKETETETSAHVCEFGDWVTVQPASCTVDGAKERSCVCGEKETEVIVAGGHDEVEHEAQEPTCVSVGWDAYVTCSKCSYSTYVEKPIDSSNHDLVEHEAKEPTCIAVGWDAYVTCSRCDYSTKVNKPVLSYHNYDEENTCRDCGEYADKGVVFTKKSNGYSVTDYTGNAESVIIPSTYRGLPVTSISSSAFYCCNSLTSVVIPDSVTSISSSAFYCCNSLTSVVIPDSVTSIGNMAFDGCTNLKYNEYDNAFYLGNKGNPYLVLVKAKDTSISSCEIHEKTRLIYYYAFYYCDSITSIVIPNSVTSIGDKAFQYCSALASVTIPDSVTSIGDNALENCTGLWKIIFPDSVTSIGKNVLRGCFSLINIEVGANNTNYKSIDGNLYSKDGKTLIRYAIGKTDTGFAIPDGVTSIGDYAFRGCNSLTSITMPDSVTSIGHGAFSYCKSLTSVVIPDSVTSIDSYAFDECRSLTSVEIGDSVTSIGDHAFSYCTSLTSVVIPDSVTSIGDSAFSSCTSLTSVEIGDSVTSIGDATFYGCDRLTSVVIPDSVTIIGISAFRSCKSLTSVEIPDGVTSIGNVAFMDCTSLTSVVIPDSVTSIGDSMFRYCGKLSSVTIPGSVTSIGNNAFEGCSSLSTVNYSGSEADWGGITIGISNSCLTGATINYNYGSETENDYGLEYTLNSDEGSYSVTGIGECEATEIVIPKMYKGLPVTSIGSRAFKGYKLTSIVIPDSVTSIGASAFLECSSLTSVEFGDNVTSIGYDAFHGCIGLTSVTIPNSVTSIETGTFSGCSGLTSVTIPESVTRIGTGAFWASGLTSVTFENEQGWWYSLSSSATSGKDISSSDLADPSTAATYLTSTYSNHYWYRD